MILSPRIEIEELVKMELPPLPSSALKVASLVQDINSSPRAIANAIGSDPALATRILKMANSAMYGLERSVTSLLMAVSTLGDQSIYQLVVVFATSDTFNKAGAQRNPIEQKMWKHSVAVGVTARELSRTLGMHGSEESFLCGLLHDMGKLLLLRYNPEVYLEIANVLGEKDMLDTERNVYGYTHAQVGALVARRWNLPEGISYAICNHHNPGESGQFTLFARIVDLADRISNSNGYGIRKEEKINLLESESVAALSLTEDQLKMIWERSEIEMKEMLSLFSGR